MIELIAYFISHLLVFQSNRTQNKNRNIINLSYQPETLKWAVHRSNEVEGKSVGRKNGALRQTDEKKKRVMLDLLKWLNATQQVFIGCKAL